jgi:hypothetical protein
MAIGSSLETEPINDPVSMTAQPFAEFTGVDQTMPAGYGL